MATQLTLEQITLQIKKPKDFRKGSFFKQGQITFPRPTARPQEELKQKAKD